MISHLVTPDAGPGSGVEVQETGVSPTRRKRGIAIALIGTFLAVAALLIFVVAPTAGASGGCGGG